MVFVPEKFLRVACPSSAVIGTCHACWETFTRLHFKLAALYRLVETSSYAVDRDSDSSSSDTHSVTNAGALTSQGSRAVQSIRKSGKEFLLKHRTYLGVQTPATGAPLKPASLASPGMAGRAAVYSKEAVR